ncbi:hypothetical protein M569_02197, partial [Genlisea aurea]
QPPVLSFLASFLERTIQKNEKKKKILQNEEEEEEETITVFHGLRPPSLTIRQYIHRIFKYSSCSPSCFVVAHIYLDRYVHRTRLRWNSLNIHRLLITSLVVAAKFMDDLFFKNSYYARVGGISTAELNELELKFLFAIDFRLFVSVQTFMNYCSLLK